MSLITRCSTCGTMFKVVADQLKISQGWVRCGHCAEVFDAAANLQPYVSPASASSAVAASQAVQEKTESAASVAPMLVAASADPETVEPVVLQEEELPAATDVSLPEVQVSPSPDLAADVFAFSVSPEPSDFSGDVPPTARTMRTESAFGESEAPEPDRTHEVSFVRQARRHAFWRRPALRWALAMAACVLLAALLLQVALFQRNALAVSQPWLSPGLHTLCAYLRCEIRPPQQIESVVIESSSFNKLAADAYRLKVVIRNAGAMALALPSLELTLTDTQDQAQLRRVLTPAELGATSPTLTAGAEFSGMVAISVSKPPPEAGTSPASATLPSGPLRIAGYRVLAFYP
ncbi:DUF3426 domain-containing protein [Polaromonas sp.]|uniref:DUF3426 domain-containing protein n=1 Tax=Polaromonas sp. TaxID=1869339 RepID=UPI003264DECB